jgi:hypothetical protein
MYPYNNSNQLSQLLLQQAIQPQISQQKVIEVAGKPGVDALQLGPDSSALALDITATIIWLIKTDGTGYKTSFPYDIKPHEDEKPIDHFKELEERIIKLEETVNAKQSNTTNARRKSDAAE